MLVYDEVHHGKSDQSARLSKACPAFYRLGLSARPLLVDYKTYSQKLLKEEYENRNGDIKERIIVKAGDARTLSFLGPIVKRVPPSVLIKAGLLARPTIYLYPLSYKDDSAEDLSWPSAKRDLIIRNRVIHNVTRKCALAAARAGETTLVVSGGSKELGLHVYQELRDANLNVAYLHGGIKKDVRTKSRHKLSTKKLEVIVATTIYDEGVDVSNLRLLVLPYGGLSPFKTEQRLGRGLRQKMGANEAVVIAFMHYGNKHLRKHSYANLKQWLEEEAYRIKLVTNRHSSYVKKLVGVDNIVDNLPDKKLFMELKHNDNGKHKDRIEATKESIEQ
jgi:superfamily II DNA or RNA helicase